LLCSECNDIKDVDENVGPYSVETCPQCNRSIKIRRPGKHGIGIEVKKGEQLFIPTGWIKLSPNPLKSSGRFTKLGLQYFAQGAFIKQIDDDYLKDVEDKQSKLEARLRSIALDMNMDLETEEGTNKFFESFREQRSDITHWLINTYVFSDLARQAVIDGDATNAAKYSVFAEQSRALSVYMDEYAEVVEMGNSAGRLVDLLRIWENNKDNKDEEFWQIKLGENSLALSQIFAAPVTFIGQKAYVGGQTIDNNSGRLADFLFAGGSGDEAIIIEIKTPAAQLLSKRKYRSNVFSVSSELSGSVIQAADYRRVISNNFEQIQGDNKIHANAPRAIIIIGKSAELDTKEKRRSFELFRTNLIGVEVITFDEVFKKIESLAGIFNLAR